MTALVIGDQIWIPQIETLHIIKAPMVNNGLLSLRGNAILLQNSGNCDVHIGMGFTLKPDQSYMFGNYNELTVQKFDQIIQFLPATATSDPVVQLLEIVEVLVNIAGSGFYIDKPTLKIT